jgi:hypothetical protein
MLLTAWAGLGRLKRPAGRTLRWLERQEPLTHNLMNSMNEIFTVDVLKELFPAQRTSDFFEALFGDANEGAYDITLRFQGQDSKTLSFSLDLHERPGRCLACNLTTGLPAVFERHKIINIAGLVQDIENKMAGKAKCGTWKLGHTQQMSKNLHSIPLQIQLA